MKDTNMKYYYLYKVTDLITAKFYIGVHETENLDDGYLGSGKRITNAIRKYGKPRFSKEILEFFDNATNMYLREAEIVTEEFCSRKDVLNLAPGGFGGTIHTNRKPHTTKHTAAAKEKIRQANLGKTHTDVTKTKISLANQKTNESRGKKVSEALRNKPKTLEHKENIRKALSGRKSNSRRTYIGRTFPDRKPREGLQHKNVTCPHCGSSGGSNIMNRWHFDKCRNKK